MPNHDGHHERRATAAANMRSGPIRNPQSAIRNRRRGFTLIELMVVIAIILVLLGILIGGMGKFAAFSSTTAATQMLASIQTAIGAYNNDFGDNPPSISTGSVGGVSVNGWQGGEILVQALSAPRGDDNKAGLGFATSAGGRNYGPYLSNKHESNMAVSSGTAPNARYKYTLADSAGKKAVLYYKADPNAAVTTGFAGVFGSGKRFNKDHNDSLDGSDPGGQNHPLYRYTTTAPVAASGIKKPLKAAEIGGFAVSLRAVDYLLVYPGPDDIYGNDDDVIATGK